MAWKDIDSVNLTNSVNLGMRNAIIRLDLTDQDCLRIAFQGTVGFTTSLLFVGGYGQGTTTRIKGIWLMKGMFIQAYINGNSESGCVYLVCTIDPQQYMNVEIGSIYQKKVSYSFVDSLPDDVTEITETCQTLNSNNMQLTDYQPTNGGGISEPSS